MLGLNRIHLYYRTQPEQQRWIPGDQYLIPILRRLIRGRKIGGIKKVFVNLCKGFDQLQINYTVNLDFKKIKANEPVIVLGNGRFALQGYQQPNPVIAGIGLMTHPAEWPGLFEEYPVATYLQHADWTRNIYTPYFGQNSCALWAAGIDAEKWKPRKTAKKYDFLIYNKIMWDKQRVNEVFKNAIIKNLENKDLSYQEISYGSYSETQYQQLLNESSAMIFLCEHESQGFACCEALSMDVPVLAWDQGFWLDPNRQNWGENKPVPATSVPFFHDRCGEKFSDLDSFYQVIDTFCKKVAERRFAPRNYILEKLTLKKSAEKMLEIVNSVYK